MKIVKTEDGFIAETFSLKENSEADGQNSEVKLISKMDKEELMNRFNLSEDELDKKLQECKEANPKAKNADCFKGRRHFVWRLIDQARLMNLY